MQSLPLLPALAVVLFILDVVFVTTWSGVGALIGGALLLEPLFLERADGPRRGARTLPSLKRLARLPAALGTLSRVRRYLLILFAVFFVLRLSVLIFSWTADDATRESLATATRIYDGALALTGLLLAVLQVKLHQMGRLALALAHRPAILLLSSFAVLIAVGSMLLILPQATHDPAGPSFVDALFNMTSSVCVTGLTANDLGASYTTFGHVVTLVGIQLGGIGMMTIAALAATFGRGSLERSAGYSATFEAKSLAEVRSLVRTVVLYTLTFELIGTLILWLHWRDAAWLGDQNALWLAAFHAISAFCNAGMSLFPNGLMGFQGDALTQITLMSLVFLGGIGFIVLRELAARLGRGFRRFILRRPVPWRRTPIGVRIALLMSGLLIALGALGFGATEAFGVLEPLPAGDQALTSAFASVVARSAGFHTYDVAQLASPTLLLLMGLMFIGGSPGSTAGGIKTTTFAVLLATLRGELRGREPELFGRAIDQRTVRRAVSVVTMTLMSIALWIFLVTLLEPDLPFLSLAFETVSAATTTGISTGLTPSLGDGTKLLLTLVMFIGRVGPLTIAYAVGLDHDSKRHRLATEEVLVG